jgi:hypothetical protein
MSLTPVSVRLPAAAAALTVGAILLGLASLQSSVRPIDRGTAGTWQKLLKLTTTASVLHTMAHPDDEHGGVVTMLSRRVGCEP